MMIVGRRYATKVLAVARTIWSAWVRFQISAYIDVDRLIEARLASPNHLARSLPVNLATENRRAIAGEALTIGILFASTLTRGS